MVWISKQTKQITPFQTTRAAREGQQDRPLFDNDSEAKCDKLSRPSSTREGAVEGYAVEGAESSYRPPSFRERSRSFLKLFTTAQANETAVDSKTNAPRMAVALVTAYWQM